MRRGTEVQLRAVTLKERHKKEKEPGSQEVPNTCLQKRGEDAI